MTDYISYDNKELRKAMKWWRSQNPDCYNARVEHHGWYGHCVMAIFQFERQYVAQVQDVVKEYRGANNG